MKNNKSEELKRVITVCIGSFIYCLGVNLFIVPSHLYSGGFTGISQLLSLLTKGTVLGNYNMQGIIFFIINIPLFLLGLKVLGIRFVSKSFVSIATQSLFFSLIPIPAAPLFDDTLTSCIVGGCVEGVGCALTFLSFASGGGLDILGVVLSKKIPNFSVGKLSVMVNFCIYGICCFLFSFEVAVYSFIASVFNSTVIDRLHKQNNTVSVNILSDKVEEINDVILNELDRASTVLDGVGAYSHEKKNLIICILSQYELDVLEKRVKEIDSSAFIFIHPNVSVLGNFEKRLAK